MKSCSRCSLNMGPYMPEPLGLPIDEMTSFRVVFWC